MSKGNWQISQLPRFCSYTHVINVTQLTILSHYQLVSDQMADIINKIIIKKLLQKNSTLTT